MMHLTIIAFLETKTVEKIGIYQHAWYTSLKLLYQLQKKISIKAIILEGYLEDQGDEPMIELKVEWLKEMIKELKEL